VAGSSDQPIERAWKPSSRSPETSAGVIAGSWFANPAKRAGELIAAGLLMLSGQTDLDELDRWMHVGWEAAPRVNVGIRVRGKLTGNCGR
jgi:hypothetical protein